MAVVRRLTDKFAVVAEAALPDNALRREKAVDAAIRLDATVNPDAVQPVLPLIPHTWYLPGAVTAGGNVAAELTMPQAGRIRRVDVRAKTPPSTGELTVYLTDDTGTMIPNSNASAPTGQSTGVAVLDHRVEPGSVLRVTISAANGAADVTVQVSYLPVAG